MLDVALNFLKDELNTYLALRTGTDTVKVSLSKVVDEVGKYAFAIDSIACSIINIEEERVLKSHLPDYTTVNGQHVATDPELKLNLHVLFVTHFTHYDQALKYLAFILTYFQFHPVFTADQYPGLPPVLGKLNMELVSLTFEQLNQIWTFVGAKQLPSVVYRLRMVTLQDTVPSGIQPPLTTINATVRRR